MPRMTQIQMNALIKKLYALGFDDRRRLAPMVNSIWNLKQADLVSHYSAQVQDNVLEILMPIPSKLSDAEATYAFGEFDAMNSPIKDWFDPHYSWMLVTSQFFQLVAGKGKEGQWVIRITTKAQQR